MYAFCFFGVILGLQINVQTDDSRNSSLPGDGIN